MPLYSLQKIKMVTNLSSRMTLDKIFLNSLTFSVSE